MRLFGGMGKSPYICSVFFIVLDLRLTKVGVRRDSFFLPLTQVVDTYLLPAHAQRLSFQVQTKEYLSCAPEY
jgi:hypothetical protein